MIDLHGSFDKVNSELIINLLPTIEQLEIMSKGEFDLKQGVNGPWQYKMKTELLFSLGVDSMLGLNDDVRGRAVWIEGGMYW